MSYLDALRNKKVKNILSFTPTIITNLTIIPLVKNASITDESQTIKSLVDSLNAGMAPTYIPGQSSKYRHIDDTGLFSVKLFPEPEPTHKCYCPVCGTDQPIDWLHYPGETHKKLGCSVCRAQSNVYEAYKIN